MGRGRGIRVGRARQLAEPLRWPFLWCPPVCHWWQMEDGTSAMLSGHLPRSAGFGASLGSCLAELYSPSSPYLLSGILQQPWTKESRTNYTPLTPSQHTQSPPPAALPLPVCSHKICPVHSLALRPAEGINSVVSCAPAWGSSLALGFCQGAKKETALC